MKFVHGSKQKIDEFKLFDYVKNSEGYFDNEFIDNGNDQVGPGIYCICIDDPKKRQRAIEYAERYAGEDGYLYFFSIDAEPEDFLDEMDTYAIDEEEWELLVENMIENRRGGLTKDSFDELVNNIIDRMHEGETIPSEEIKEKFLKFGFDAGYYETKDKDPYEWEDDMNEAYFNSEPASYIWERGGPKEIVKWAIEGSDNSWDVLKYIWNATAVLQTGKGIETYNNSFYRAAFQTFKERTPVGAYVKDEDFHVIFDADSISIDKVLEVNPKEQEMTY